MKQSKKIKVMPMMQAWLETPDGFYVQMMIHGVTKKAAREVLKAIKDDLPEGYEFERVKGEIL